MLIEEDKGTANCEVMKKEPENEKQNGDAVLSINIGEII